MIAEKYKYWSWTQSTNQQLEFIYFGDASSDESDEDDDVLDWIP